MLGCFLFCFIRHGSISRAVQQCCCCIIGAVAGRRRAHTYWKLIITKPSAEQRSTAETLGDNGDMLERCALTENDEGQLEVLLGFKLKKRMEQVEKAAFKGDWCWVKIDTDTWNETASRAYFVRDHHRMSRDQSRPSKVSSTLSKTTGKRAQEKRGSSTEPRQLSTISTVSGTSAVSSTLVTVDRKRGNVWKGKPYGQMASTTLVGPAQLTAASAEPAYEVSAYEVPQMPAAGDTLRQTCVQAGPFADVSSAIGSSAGIASPGVVQTTPSVAMSTELPLAELSLANSVSEKLSRARMARAPGVQSRVQSQPVTTLTGVAGGAADQETTHPPNWHLIKDTPEPSTMGSGSVVADASPTANAPIDLAADAPVNPSSADSVAGASKTASDEPIKLWI